MTTDGRLPDTRELQEISERLAGLVERSQKVWAESLDRSAGDLASAKPDPLNTLPALSRLAQTYMDQPQKLVEASLDYWTRQADIWTRIMKKSLGEGDSGPAITPEKGDKRFKDEMWEQNPYFDYLKQSYLLTGDWLKKRLKDAEDLSPQDRRKLEFLTRNYIEALSPTNYAVTNPEVLKATVEERGENLMRGLDNLLRDIEHGKGQLIIQQTDKTAFKVGENIAVTPGKVVHQNEVMQLIQYTPATDEVYKRPILIVPPWINKFYILDLNEKKSLIRWLVGQGHTVFVLSWINPGAEQATETWESYMQKGPLTAIGKALEETGEDKVNLVGYCIGGTMTGTTLAYMAATGDDRVGSATFFTTQLDFSDAGDLGTFIDDKSVEAIESKVAERGYLAAENMAAAFNSLRSTDLIWGFVINNYLLGKENFPFDLLYWNSDSTNMPGRVHVFYLDQFYNRNTLATGDLKIGGVVLDLGKVKVPAYHVATIEDHIAPAPSAFRAAKLLGSRSQRFVLAGSGHIAGVVNPPAGGKYQYLTKTGLKGSDLEEWRQDTEETAGSWWPDWDAWLAKQSKGKKVPARQPGSVLGQIEDAPGSYVKVRFDQE
ncbi:MAG TPA: class I poly(R)-hydroxyalkanoic acid synthase [Thermohalobaculum sp.]|nr:class I poly(R)-hydroxyalkanoic acid synthase [Thermohalobaculum sp.]